MTGWEIYWITRLDGIRILAGVSIIVIFAISVIYMIFKDDEYRYGKKEKEYTAFLWKYLKKILPVFMIPILLLVLTPTTKEMFAIKILPKIINNEKLQELPELGLDYMKQWLKEQTEELEDEEPVIWWFPNSQQNNKGDFTQQWENARIELKDKKGE